MRGNPSFHTMNIHHFAGILSLLHSYLTNFEEYGMVVMIFSDMSDAVLNFAKQSRDINLLSGFKLDAVFGFLIIVWIYSRTIMLPVCFTIGISNWLTLTPEMFLQKPDLMRMYDSVRPGLHFVFFNVYCICLLNIYWTKLILGMLVDKIFTKGNYKCDYEGDKSTKSSKHLSESVSRKV